MQIYSLDITPENLLFIANVVLHRMFFSFAGTIDPVSDPFVSGDSFRSFADHIFDSSTHFSPQNIQEKDIIFVDFGHLERFFSEIHPRISARYILITHNGDLSVDKRWIVNLDKK